MNFVVILFVFYFVLISLFFQSPKKSKYNNLFLAWLTYLILFALVLSSLYLLVSYELIPVFWGKIRGRFGYDGIYWGIIGLISLGVIQFFMYSLTRLFKIQKTLIEEDSK
jgi:hypothetical protein